MRGRLTCPTGQKKNSVEATAGSAPFFYKERLGTGSPPHPPQCAHWGTFPPRGRLGGWRRSGAETFFRKNAFSAYFLLEKASQIGLRISEEIVPRTDQSQPSPNPASGNERLSKPGVQGACPRPSFSPFLGRNGDPRRAGGPPGRCAPRLGKAPTTRRVRPTGGPRAPGPTWRAYGLWSKPGSPPGTGREPTSQVRTCGGPEQNHLPKATPASLDEAPNVGPGEAPRPHVEGRIHFPERRKSVSSWKPNTS